MNTMTDQQTDQPISRHVDLVQFGQCVRRYRKHAGLNQEELAQSANLHRTYLSDIERGNRNLSLTSIISLANALNVPIAELCKGIGPQVPQVAK